MVNYNNRRGTMLLLVTMNVLSRVTTNKIAEIKDPFLKRDLEQAGIMKIMRFLLQLRKLLE